VSKRALSWELPEDEIQLSLPPPQDADIQETKRPRLEEPVPTSTDATGNWTLEEDAELTSAVANAWKTKWAIRSAR
jgi:hypothetical protein